jgi:hypothetical protein
MTHVVGITDLRSERDRAVPDSGCDDVAPVSGRSINGLCHERPSPYVIVTSVRLPRPHGDIRYSEPQERRFRG